MHALATSRRTHDAMNCPSPLTRSRQALLKITSAGVFLLLILSPSGSAQAHTLLAAGAPADTEAPRTPSDAGIGTAPWAHDESWIVDALTHGNVLRLEPIGHGITNPFRAEIHHEGRRLHAVWKPIVNGDYEEHESYQAEIAAYRLSRALGLDMVPPTVERKVGRRWGSLQFWVDGYELFAEAVGHRPIDGSIIPRLEAMRFFDALIDNPDRHAGNYMVDAAWNVVLIDHSRAFDGASRATRRIGPDPTFFPALAVDRLRRMSAEDLDELLGDVTGRSTRRRLLRSARGLVELADRAVAAQGTKALFDHEALFSGSPAQVEPTLVAQQP